MYYVYILKSLKDNSYYIGQTSNLENRVEQHNRGKSSYTKRKSPWKLVHYEKFHSRKEAMKRERDIKRKKSRKYIDNLISTINN